MNFNPRPSSDVGSNRAQIGNEPAGVRIWGLSAYPVTEAFRQRAAAQLRGTLQVAYLSELRSEGLGGILLRLHRTHADIGCVLMEDSSSEPVGPVLRFFLSLTRCRRLVLMDNTGAVRPFRRVAGLADLGRVVVGSLAGALAASSCALHLLAMARRRVVYHRPQGEARRVLYLKTNLWFGVKAGGSVGHVSGVVNALARQSERVDVLAVECPPLLAPGVHYHRVRNARAFGHPFELNYYRYQRTFRRHVRQIAADARPTAIYHRTSIANYSGLDAKRELRIPLIVEYNGSEVWVASHWGRPLLLPRLAAMAENESLRHADIIVTVSDVLGDELRERGIDPARIVVHPNCVDGERFDPSRFASEDRAALLSRHGIATESTVCGFIGTFGAWHGVLILAETIRDLAETNRPWLEEHCVHFLLVGDGLLMPEVRRVLADPRVARFVTLTGLVEQHLAPCYLAACDILLSPHVPNADGSRFFGSPTKLFEYMAMEKGIVASDLDQIGDVLRRSYTARSLPSGPCHDDDVHLAVLVKPGSRAELIAGVRFLVERPDYRRILGRNARREVLARYTWERNVDAVLSQLDKVSGPPPTAPRVAAAAGKTSS